MLHSLVASLRSGHPGIALRYAAAVAAALLTLLLSELLRPIILPNPFLLFFAAIAISAWYGGIGPGLLTTGLTVVAASYFFQPPFYAIKLDLLDIVRLMAFSLVAVLISSLSETRRRDAQAAHTQREQLQVMLASIGDAVIATDATGQITFINPVAAQLTGWSPTEAQGQPISAVFRIINAETRQPVESPVSNVQRAGVIVGLANHTLLLARDGTERLIDDSVAPIRDAQGTLIGVVMVFRDITARDYAEAERTRLVADTQAARDTAEQAARQITRLQRVTAALGAATTPDQVADVVVQDGLAALEADAGAIFLLADEGRTWEVLSFRGYPPELVAGYVRTSVDAPSPLRDALETQAMLVVETSEELRERWPQLAELQACSGDAAIAAVPLLLDKQILGMLYATFRAPRRFSADDKALLEGLARQGAQALERARLYEAERAARMAAEAALQTREHFLSVAAHELKTPLTSLLLQTQLLQRRALRSTTLIEQDRRGLQVVADQARRLDQMIAALLDVSRLDLGQLSLTRGPVDLCTLTRRVAAELQPTSASHTLNCLGPEEGLIADGDELRLEQVLQHLFQNAIKYSPDGGGVDIEVTPHDGVVCVTVADQGIGIPEEALPQLFERFYRAPNADPRQISGIGIGLYVVREIVHLHGGSVTAARRPDSGSIFTVYLPQWTSAPEVEAPTQAQTR